MPLSNSNFPLHGVQNKQERHQVFENMQGFYNGKTVTDYYKPVDSTKKTITYIWFNNQFIDPCKMYGLYKCLVINTKSDYDSLSNVATVPLLENLYSMSISGAVLDYNKTTDDYRLTIVDYDDKTRFDLTGSNEKCFHGILSEFALNSKTNNLDLSGGVVGGIRLKKMKYPLPDFKNISFDTLYAQKYNAAYPTVPT
jgi:hypothetical protein